jgi:hypothetical protein
LDTGDYVGGDAVVRGAVYEFRAVWVAAGDVEEVDTGEDYEEAGEEREGVYGVGGVEAAVEDEGGAEGGGCEGYVVEGVDAVELSISIFPLQLRGV